MKRTLKLGAAILSLSIAAGCTAPNTARRVLTMNGYTNVHILGYAWFTCGKDDDFHTAFSATSPSGKQVKGAVCSGWFKGATIRFD